MKIIPIKKSQAASVCGTLTATSKMPCKSLSLPTESCITGSKMAEMPGSICSSCYANKGFYSMYANTIKPAQFSRLDAIWQALESQENAELWVSGMVSLIGSDSYFRWHDSGDLQSLEHLELIVHVCEATPGCKHWLPTREYGIIKDYISKHGKLPANLIVRLSAMYPDKPVKIPSSLVSIQGITASNVHTSGATIHGERCTAPDNNGSCGECRACWSGSIVSYEMH